VVIRKNRINLIFTPIVFIKKGKAKKPSP